MNHDATLVVEISGYDDRYVDHDMTLIPKLKRELTFSPFVHLVFTSRWH